MSQFTTQPSSSRFVPQPYDVPQVSTKSSTTPTTVPTTTYQASSQRFFSSSETNTREASEFVNQYDALALRHGLKRLDAANLAEVLIRSAPSVASGNSPKAPRRWFSRKILRRTVSTMSLSNAGAPLQPMTLKETSLEMTARLAGVSVLRLGRAFTPKPLTLPNALCVLATCLQDHAQSTSEIFRIVGNHQTVTKICDHLDRYLKTTGADDVDQTVGSVTLPTYIEYTVHDVASAFRRLLSSTTGGILGSMGLFLALRDIQMNLAAHTDAYRAVETKSRMIALAISSVTFELRFSVICAVLGLAAMIAETAGPLSTEDRLGNLIPSSDVKSLSKIFGPLLLANLFDEIHASPQYDRGAPSAVSTPAQHLRKSWAPFRSTKRPPSLTQLELSSLADYDRYEQCSAIVEMLLCNWKETIRQLRQLCGVNGLPRPLTPLQVEQEESPSSSSYVHPEATSAGHTPFAAGNSVDVQSSSQIAPMPTFDVSSVDDKDSIIDTPVTGSKDAPLKPLVVEDDVDDDDDQPTPRPVGIQSPHKNPNSGRWLPPRGSSVSPPHLFRRTAAKAAESLHEDEIRPPFFPCIYPLPRTPVTRDNLEADDLFWDPPKIESTVANQNPPHDDETAIESSPVPHEYLESPSRPTSITSSRCFTVRDLAERFDAQVRGRSVNRAPLEGSRRISAERSALERARRRSRFTPGHDPNTPEGQILTNQFTATGEYDILNTVVPLGWVPVLDGSPIRCNDDEYDSGSEPEMRRLSYLSDDGDIVEPTDFESAMKRVVQVEREKDWWMGRALTAEVGEKRLKRENVELKKQVEKLKE